MLKRGVRKVQSPPQAILSAFFCLFPSPTATAGLWPGPGSAGEASPKETEVGLAMVKGYGGFREGASWSRWGLVKRGLLKFWALFEAITELWGINSGIYR